MNVISKHLKERVQKDLQDWLNDHNKSFSDFLEKNPDYKKYLPLVVESKDGRKWKAIKQEYPRLIEWEEIC
jgi:hypothetical protein